MIRELIFILLWRTRRYFKKELASVNDLMTEYAAFCKWIADYKP